MAIDAARPGWAEQDPDLWWRHMRLAVEGAVADGGVGASSVLAIGIAYQMHGLVLVDDRRRVLRPAIIWCDSRAVATGEAALAALGAEECFGRLLNAPGNFTASKLGWVRQNEPEIYDRAWKMMLPGDWLAMRLTGEVSTTISGLSEGTLWDFRDGVTAKFLLDQMEVDSNLVPELVPTFGEQGVLSAEAADQLGLRAGTPVSYRAGDQPNNALALGALEPGEVAATAGTSAVVYGVTDRAVPDRRSRVNTFAHVNHGAGCQRLGVLLCINGAGALNAWLRRNVAADGASYDDMNNLAATAAIGSDGLAALPFGNGAERLLENRNIGCSFVGLDLQRHSTAHLLRAAQEGIACALAEGMAVQAELGLDLSRIRASNANLFLSPVFRQSLAGFTETTIEVFDTDGPEGAARAAGAGAGIHESPASASSGMEPRLTVRPDSARREEYAQARERWQYALGQITREP